MILLNKNEYGERVMHNIGTFDTPEEAFIAYKRTKKARIREVVDSYYSKIPEPMYSRLRVAAYNYQVEITD